MLILSDGQQFPVEKDLQVKSGNAKRNLVFKFFEVLQAGKQVEFILLDGVEFLQRGWSWTVDSWRAGHSFNRRIDG